LFLAAWSAYLVGKLSRRMQLEHAAVERAVNRADRLSVMGYFAGEMAHEVGNPLSAISSLVQTLRDGEVSPERVEKLGMVASQVERLIRTVERIKGSIRGEKRLEVLPLSAVVQDAVLLLRFDGHLGSGVRIVVGAMPPELRIVADRWAVVQILTNLILNSAEALGAVGGVVQISGERAGSGVQIAVRDNGPGIPESVRDGLFGLFVTSKPQGTGIGLFISRRLAESMGGSLAASDRPEGGAEFVLGLPAPPEG
jgi:signal transduction histidine kinase